MAISNAQGRLLCRSVDRSLTPCVGCRRGIYQVLYVFISQLHNDIHMHT